MSIEAEIARKNARKARPGGLPKWINLPRNWLHQAVSYMDAGELWFRLAVETAEIIVVWVLLTITAPGLNGYLAGSLAFVIAHTWNWVTNGLFWSVVMFTFPGLRNRGEDQTIEYLHKMTERLRANKSITGFALYGSISRGQWHERSDLDMRLLRRQGFTSLVGAALCTMRERFIALLERQPSDLYLADDIDFLRKLRSDEIPVLLIKQDERLEKMYPNNPEKVLTRLCPENKS